MAAKLQVEGGRSRKQRRQNIGYYYGIFANFVKN